MGTTFRTKCACGDQSDKVMIGSSRREHGKVFHYPHACMDCRSVVSADLLSKPCACPHCGTSNIERYGASLTEAPHGRWHNFLGLITGRSKRDQATLDSFVGRSLDITYCFNTSTTYALLNQPAACPKCKENKMKFIPGDLFD